MRRIKNGTKRPFLILTLQDTHAHVSSALTLLTKLNNLHALFGTVERKVDMV